MPERIKRSYQSVWMARWTQTTFNVDESDNSRSSNEFKEIETRSFGIVNDSLALGFRNLRNGEYPEYHVRNPLEQVNMDDGLIGSSSRTVPRKFERISSIIHKESQSVHDPTLRIGSLLNSSMGRFSQNTRGLQITEDTKVNLREEKQIMRESRALTKFTGKKSSKRNSFFRLFGDDDEEEEENFQKLKPFEVQTTESSTETDTMDIDGLKDNPFSGIF